MESISGTYLGDLYKSFPKLQNPSLITAYTHLPRVCPARQKDSKLQKPTKQSNDSIYTGEVNSSNEKSGFGLLTIPEGLYEGQFDSDHIQGQGRVFKPFTIIEGEFTDLDLSQGKIFNLKENSTYEGEIRNLKPHGKGKLELLNVYTYTGEFKNGLKEGLGDMQWKNNDRYKGEFAKDKQHGNGKFVTNDGACYDGEWILGKMHGKGVLVVKGNYKYDGSFSAGQKQGQGKCVWNDGKKYEGFWMKGKYDGFGKETTSDGRVLEGIWRNGVFKFAQGEDVGKGTGADRGGKVEGFAVEKTFQDEVVKDQSSVLSKKSSKSLSNAVNYRNQSPILEKGKNEVSFQEEQKGQKVPVEGEFGVDLSLIKDPESAQSSDSERAEQELNELGPEIKDFVLSRSSQANSLSHNSSIASNSKFKSKAAPSAQFYPEIKFENTPNESNRISNKNRFSPRSESSSISENRKFSPNADKSENYSGYYKGAERKITIQEPILPTIIKKTVIIKKTQLVSPLEIRSCIRTDPLFQISYQKFKSLSLFQYDDMNLEDIVLLDDWITLNKEKIYRGFVNSSNLPHGNGVQLQRGRIYQGGFFNGKKQGLGRLITPLGRLYEGYWFHGKKHGFGVFQSETETYCGDWCKGLYHGLGVMHNSQGVYDGEFIFGICEGKGILEYEDGKIFEGQFKNGVPHGFGNLKIGSEISFDQWKEGAKKILEVTTMKKVTPIKEEIQIKVEESVESASESESEVDIPLEVD